MTNEELQEVVAAVIAALKTNGKTIDQLTAVTALADTDNLEISGGKKVAFGKLKELVASSVVITEESIKGWVPIESTEDLPEEPTPEEQEKAYIIAEDSMLYVYVGEGGDTLDGLYQSVELQGPQGETGPAGADGHDGVDLGEVALINDLTTGGEGAALSAEMGKTLKGMIPAVVNDLTTGGEASALSAEMGKILMSGGITGGDEEFEMTKTGKYMNVGTVGSTAAESSAGGFGYVKIPVTAGDYFAILSKGTNSSARTWALTDGDLKVLSNTNQVYVNFPTLVQASSNGFLIVNNYFDSFANPKIVKVVGGVTGEFSISVGNGYIGCATVGSTIQHSASGTWGYYVVPVVSGQTATIYTKGGANARAWATIGTGDEVLSNASSNLDASSTPAVVSISGTCLLLINDNNYSGAKVILAGGGGVQQPNLTDHEERIDALEALHPTKSLKILAIGNSFTENALEYMPNFLTNLNVEHVTIYRETIAASSIESWWTRYQNDYSISPTKVVGSTIDNIGGTLEALFAHDWDYIVFQQVSTDSGTYSTIEPNLYSLIAHVKALCTNPNCKVAWHMTWSWSSLGTGTAPKGTDGFASIASVVEDILDYYRGAGVDVIIPSGAAMQNARGTSLNNEAELTKDYQHAASGVAKYIITATWYETLIKEFAGKSAMESTLDVSATASSSDLGAESVSSTNRNLCLTCMEYAMANPFHISTIVE